MNSETQDPRSPSEAAAPSWQGMPAPYQGASGAPPAYPAQAARAPQRTVQIASMLLVLGVLAVATVIAFASLIDIVEVWFEYQYVPIARAVLSILVAGLCVYVLRVLVKRPT